MKTYADLLNEKIYCEKYNITAHFEEKENLGLCIVSDGNKSIELDCYVIPFKIAFSTEFYDIFLLAAIQLLEATIMLDNVFN